MLYQALTGRLPFVGRPLEVLVDKQRIEPVAPPELAADVPDDLNTLCIELLRRDPDARPAGCEVLRRLGNGPDELHFPYSQRFLPRQAAPLIGRQRHLQILDAAFQAQPRADGRRLRPRPLGGGKDCLGPALPVESRRA